MHCFPAQLISIRLVAVDQKGSPGSPTWPTASQRWGHRALVKISQISLNGGVIMWDFLSQALLSFPNTTAQLGNNCNLTSFWLLLSLLTIHSDDFHKTCSEPGSMELDGIGIFEASPAVDGEVEQLFSDGGHRDLSFLEPPLKTCS